MTNELVQTEANLWKSPRGVVAKAMIPAVDIFESQEEIVLLADMPGVTRESLSIDVEKDVLSVHGTVSLDIPCDAVPLLAEVNSRRYARTFTLSRELDTNRIDAQMRDGLLTLRIPKTAESKPRKIEVKSG